MLISIASIASATQILYSFTARENNMEFHHQIFLLNEAIIPINPVSGGGIAVG